MARVLRKLQGIVVGWYFLAINRNHKIAKERLKICAGCELRKGFVCGICTCPLIAMTRLTGEYDEGCSDTPKRWPAKK